MPMPNLRQKLKKVMSPKVLVIDFRPAAIPPAWNKTDYLIQNYIETMRQVSNNTLAFQMVKKITVPGYPVLADGRQYNDTTWSQARFQHSGPGQGDGD